MITKRYLLLMFILFLVSGCSQRQSPSEKHDFIYLDKLQVEGHLPFRSFEDLSKYLHYMKSKDPALVDTQKVWQWKGKPNYMLTTIKEDAIGPLLEVKYSTPDLIFSWKCDNSSVSFFVNFEAFDSKLKYYDLEFSRQTPLTDLKKQFPTSYELPGKYYQFGDAVIFDLKVYPDNGWLSIAANEVGIAIIHYNVYKPNQWVNRKANCNLPAL